MLDLITKFGKFLALTPTTNKLTTNIYSVLVVVILTTSSIVSTGVYRQEFYADFTEIKLTITVCMVITVNIFGCYAITMPLFCKWKHYNRFMIAVLPAKPKNTLLSPSTFAAMNLLYWVIWFYTAYVWGDIMGTDKYLKAYFPEAVQLYLQYYYTIFLYAAIKEIRRRYKQSNRLLANMARFRFHESIRSVENLRLELKQLTSAFNELFGWPILMIILYSNLLLLSYLDEVIKSNFKYDKYQFVGAVASNVTVALMTNACTVALVLACDAVLREARKGLDLGYTLRRQIKDRSELADFLRFLRDNQPEFTAAGFFRIDKSAILSMAGSVTTFFIIMVQFNAANK